MRLQAARTILLPAVAVMLMQSSSLSGATEATTCKTLLDADSALVDGLESSWDIDLSEFPFSTVFAELDTALPWFSKCAASFMPMTAYTAATTNDKLLACVSEVEDYGINPDLSKQNAWSGICDLYESTIMPCLKDALSDIVMDAFAATGGCCDDFLAKIQSLFTDSLDTMVVKLAEIIGNIACSKRTFTNVAGAETTEFCGYSIFQAISSVDDIDEETLLSLVQLPNNQMCVAMEGGTFTNTKSGTAQIGFGADGADTMGICEQPLDVLLQHIASWPFFYQTLDANGVNVSLSDLFASGKSVRGDLFVDWASTSTNLPKIVMRTIDSVIVEIAGEDNVDPNTVVDGFTSVATDLRSAAKALLLHIPNHGECTYADQKITNMFAVETTVAIASDASVICFPMSEALAMISSILAVILFN